MTIAELFVKLGLKPDKESFDGAERLISGIKTAMAGLVAFKTAEWFHSLIEDTVELGGKLMDLSQTAGVPIETLQELSYAAVQNSGSLEQMVNGLGKLSKNLYAAAQGGQEQAKAFATMGIKIRNTDGTLRASEDVLADIADHFASMPDGAEKVAQSMQVLGRSGAELIPTLNLGSKGLAEMRQEARDLGGILSEDSVKALDDFGDQQDKIKFALSGLRNEVALQLLPTLKDIAGSILTWIKANKKLVAQKIVVVIQAIISVLKVLGKITGVVTDVFLFLSNNMAIVKVGLLALTSAMLIYRAAAIGTALASAAAWALSVLPFVLLGAIIAALILVIQDLYSWANGGDSVFKDLWESAKKSTNGVVQGFVTAIEAVQTFITKIKEAIQGLVDLGREIGKSDAFSDLLSGLTGGATQKLQDEQGDQFREDEAARAGQAAKAASQPGGNYSPYNPDGTMKDISPWGDYTKSKAGAFVPKGGDTTTHVNMTVNSSKADPKEVAVEVSKAFTSLMDGVLRNTARAVGGGGS